jgi:hypothetical protein
MKQPFAVGALKSIRFAGMFVFTSHKLSAFPEQMYYSLSLLYHQQYWFYTLKYTKTEEKIKGIRNLQPGNSLGKKEKCGKSQGPNDLHSKSN